MPSPWAACADPCFGAPDHEAGDAIENNDPADRTRLEDHLGYLQKTTRDELAHSDITLYKMMRMGYMRRADISMLGCNIPPRYVPRITSSNIGG